MKPVLSFLLIFSLIQSLFTGSQVNLELYSADKSQWQETHFLKQDLPDICAVPPRGSLNQSFQNRNYGIPFQYNNVFAFRIESPLAAVARIPFGPVTFINYYPAPLYILNGAMRI